MVTAVAGNANDEGETEPHISIIIKPSLEPTRQKAGILPYQAARLLLLLTASIGFLPQFRQQERLLLYPQILLRRGALIKWERFRNKPFFGQAVEPAVVIGRKDASGGQAR